ncbi:hypothetical protein [Metasolibacillus sp.]|uniref:hypothetical protein n=1 Tax=Metasolibacillus sp. TaxID=2703680 RepID=UPI0025D224B7|nr:hypothetical protein [Metasolibacillus sp.]MCT6924075.1 hypothetical protein [Metasolibacillus sp.]MCT6940182.1 hypothetical protein [Metasolibacillus sp.]
MGILSIFATSENINIIIITCVVGVVLGIVAVIANYAHSAFTNLLNYIFSIDVVRYGVCALLFLAIFVTAKIIV